MGKKPPALLVTPGPPYRANKACENVRANSNPAGEFAVPVAEPAVLKKPWYKAGELPGTSDGPLAATAAELAGKAVRFTVVPATVVLAERVSVVPLTVRMVAPTGMPGPVICSPATKPVTLDTAVTLVSFPVTVPEKFSAPGSPGSTS